MSGHDSEDSQAGQSDVFSGVAPPGAAGSNHLPVQRYIVVEGPIGVGKTSLAKRLAGTLEAELVLEQDAQNPFLERFYKNPKSARCRRSCSSCSSGRSSWAASSSRTCSRPAALPTIYSKKTGCSRA